MDEIGMRTQLTSWILWMNEDYLTGKVDTQNKELTAPPRTGLDRQFQTWKWLTSAGNIGGKQDISIVL